MESYEKTEAQKLAEAEKGRRKVQRVSQARQQANTWLSERRQQVEAEKSRSLQELISEVTTEITDGAIRNLEELSRVHLSAVGEIGTAHRAAAAYPDYQSVKERKSVEYEQKAQDRYSQAVRKSRQEESLRHKDAQRLSRIRQSVRAEEDLKSKSLVDRRPFRARNVEVKPPESLRDKLKRQGYQQSLAKTLDVPGAPTDHHHHHPKHVVKKRKGKSKASSRHKKQKSPGAGKPKRVSPLEIAANARATGVKVQPMHRYHSKRSPRTSPVPRMRRPRSKKTKQSRSPGDVIFVDSNIPLPPQKYKAPDGLAVRVPYDPSAPSAWDKANHVNHKQEEADRQAAHNKAVTGKKAKERGERALKIARLEQRYNQLTADLMTTIEEGDEESSEVIPPPPTAPTPTNDLATRLKAKYEEIMADADAQLKKLNSHEMESLPKSNVVRVNIRPPPATATAEAKRTRAIDQGDQGEGFRPATAATNFAAIAKARLDQLMALGEELGTVPFPQLPDWVHTPREPPQRASSSQVTTSMEERRAEPATAEIPFSVTPADFGERLKAKFAEIMTVGSQIGLVGSPSRSFVPTAPIPTVPSPKAPPPPSPSSNLVEPPQAQEEMKGHHDRNDEGREETNGMNPPDLPVAPRPTLPPPTPRQGEQDDQVVTPAGSQKTPRSRTGQAVTSTTGQEVDSRTGQAVDSRTGQAVESRTGQAVDSRTGQTVDSRTEQTVDSRTGQKVNTETVPPRQPRPKRKKKVPSTVGVPTPPPADRKERSNDAARNCLRHYITKLLVMDPDQRSKLTGGSRASSIISDSSNVQINTSAVSSCASNGSITPAQAPVVGPPADSVNQSRRSSKKFHGSSLLHSPQETSTPKPVAAASAEKSKDAPATASPSAAATTTSSSMSSSKFPEVDVNVVYDSSTDGGFRSSVERDGMSTSQDTLRHLLQGLCLRQAYCLSSPPPPPPSSQEPRPGTSVDGNESLDIERRLAALLGRGKPGAGSGPGSTSDEGRLRGGTSTPTREMTSIFPGNSRGPTGTSTDDEFQLSNSPLNISVHREQIPQMIGQVADQWKRISILRPDWSDLESLPDEEQPK